MRRAVLALVLAAPAWGADTGETVARCLSCHLQPNGQIDITGVRALQALPPEWPLLHEDAFDLDGDGVAGVAQHVSGEDGPLIARWGANLAAARFEDFARIAGAAHGIPVEAPGVLDALRAAFEARSPAPVSPFASAADLERFRARGCNRCHVTDTYQADGETVMPLSDFLLHDLGDGPRRTRPLWGCPDCVRATPH